MGCACRVGDKVDLADNTCWVVVAKWPSGICNLRNADGNEISVDCSQVRDCSHTATLVNALSAPITKRRVSKGKAAPTKGKKKAVSRKKPVRPAGKRT